MATTAYLVKRLGVMSIAKFSAVFGLIWGFFMGIPVAAGLNGVGSMMDLHSLGVGAGIVGLIVMIIIGGIFGFIGGAVMAFVYNIVLGAVGGIEMDLEVKQ